MRNGCVFLGVVFFGCGPRIVGGPGAGSADGTAGDTDQTDGDSASSGSDPHGPVPLYEIPLRQLDLLVVVDNSASTSPIQAKLVSAIEPLLDIFEAADVQLDYRLAVTTTDSGNYWCDNVTEPEYGNFVSTSCRERIADFTWADVDDSATCFDWCSLETLSLPQPWIEVVRAQSNLPAGVSAVDAAACLIPQGVGGCGYESPLESMRRALTLSATEGSPQQGFVRDTAVLMVVIVTDEVDCSAASEFQETVFSPEGNRLFWSLPDEPTPTSAVCWNAGVRCSGPSSGYDSCNVADKGTDGAPAVPDAAVLTPVAEYIDALQAIEDQKKAINPSAEVRVSVIAGVPVDHPLGEPIAYAEGPDPDDREGHQAVFGIGPGCSGDGEVSGVPPVRLREFASAFHEGDPNLHSVCADSYLDALFVQVGGHETRPACVAECVADVDAAPGLQPSCTLVETWVDEAGGSHEVVVPSCLSDHGVPDGTDVCFSYLTDRDRTTESAADDMHQSCIDEGANLEIRVTRRPGVPAAGGTIGTLVCEPSPDPATDCP